MTTYAREEILDTVRRFEEANARAERDGEWSRLADFYTEDAVYTYVGLTAGGTVEARGREEIRRVVLGRDMEPYRGWTYPYEWVSVDGNRVVTKWWNRAPGPRADGTPIQCPGISVLEYAGGGRFRSQFDLFDRLSVKECREEWERVAAGAR